MKSEWSSIQITQYQWYGWLDYVFSTLTCRDNNSNILCGLALMHIHKHFDDEKVYY